MKKQKIWKKPKDLPRVLEEQIYIRCGLGAGAVLLGVVFLAAVGMYFGLAWLLLGAYLLCSGITIAVRCSSGSVTCIRGTCKEVERVGFRKTPRSIILLVDDIPMRVLLRRKNQLAIREGDTVSVYTSDRTSVYVKDGYDYICSYYAIQAESKKKDVYNG